ncbi:hypothetical protein [Scytonema sp. PRP1]
MIQQQFLSQASQSVSRREPEGALAMQEVRLVLFTATHWLPYKNFIFTL